jgi:Family of unknown function (DUF6174)
LSSLAAAIVAGCSGGITEPELTYQAALSRWRDAGLKNYSFRSTVHCFCLLVYSNPMTVTVRNGQVVSVVDRVSGAVRPTSYRQPIDSLFAMAAEEIRLRPERLQVTYDPALGFPRTLTYGMPETDGGGFIYADSLRAEP